MYCPLPQPSCFNAGSNNKLAAALDRTTNENAPIMGTNRYCHKLILALLISLNSLKFPANAVVDAPDPATVANAVRSDCQSWR